MDNQTRQAQHSYQMYQCLMNSLTESGRLRILSESSKYTINDKMCGPLLYRFLISKATIDSRGTLSHIRENLSNLDSYMPTVNCNITKFNEYVKEQVNNLKSRGGVTHDLLTHLWKAYSVVSDQQFVAYIGEKKNRYDDGLDVEPEDLMVQAENKYKSLLLEEKWNALSPEQTQVVALTEQVNKLSSNKVRLGNKNKNKNKNRRRDGNPSNTSNNNDKKKSKSKFKDKWAWKKVPP